MLGYSFAGLMGGSTDGSIPGKVVRSGGKWYFVTRYAGVSFRYVFDVSSMCYPQVGPAALYGAIGTNSLAAVFQKGCAVGWFRGDQRGQPVDKS